MFILWLLTILGGAIAFASLRKQLTQNEDLIDRLMRRMDRLEREGGVAPSTAAPAPEMQSPAARVAAMASRLPVARVVAEPPPVEEAPEEPTPVVEPAPIMDATPDGEPIVPIEPTPAIEAPPVVEPEPVAEPVPVVEAPTPPSRVARIVSAPTPSAPAENKPLEAEGASSEPAAVTSSPWQPKPDPDPASQPPRDPSPAREKITLEALIGGKLPIWVGSIALILSAFFLVRYSIEQGLLGPGVRSVLAGIFGIGLIVASEAAKRIPRFADDPRVGQALSGAGIASLYGTLYMAGQLYGLISPTVAFVLMAAVTGGALFLSLRHGPPTAILGLVGGFTAPFLAAPSGNLVPLLVYLGLLIAGLFAVAIQRGWMWLALAATGGGAVWTFGILAADLAGIGPSLGLFIVVLALAATMLFPRAGANDPRIRILPMVVGFVQLALFAPAIQFDVTGWALYGLLSVASLYLGWRDPKLMPATLAALGLVLILLFAAFEQGKPLALWVALASALLFAVPGHIFARKNDVTDKYWTSLVLGGVAGPLLVLWISQGSSLLSANFLGFLFVAAAALSFSLSWRAKGEGQLAAKPDWALFGGAMVAGIMAFIANVLLTPDLWVAAAGFAIMLGVAAWARRVQDSSLFVASIPFGAVAGIFWTFSYVARPYVNDAIFIDGGIPPFEDLAALLLVPMALFAATAWCHRGRLSDEPLRWIGLAFAAAVPLALVPAVWHAAAMTACTAALALWAKQSSDPFRFRASLALVTPAALFWLNRMVLNPSMPLAIVGDEPMPSGLYLMALFAVPALLLAVASWLHKGQISREALRWFVLGLALGLALAIVPPLWHALTCFAAAAGLAAWYRKSSDAFFERASIAPLGAGLFYWMFELGRHSEVALSIFGDGAMPEARVLVALLAAPAVATAAMAWGLQGRAFDTPTRWFGLGLVTALVLSIMPFGWHGPALAAMAGAAAFGAARLPLPRYGVEALILGAAVSTLLRLLPFAQIMIDALTGVPTHYGEIDPIDQVIIACGLPALLFGLIWWKMRDHFHVAVQRGLIGLAGAAGIATLYALIKQPLAIATEDQFVAWGFIERAIITQSLAAIGLLMLWRGGEKLRTASSILLALSAARLIGFDLLMFNPVLVDQNVGSLPIANAATIHFGLASAAAWWVGLRSTASRSGKMALRFSALGLVVLTVALTVRQAFQGAILTALEVPNAENYGYSIAFLILSLLWLWRGIAGGERWLRMTGLGLLTLVTLKVFLIDAAALEGLLRVLSFMGLGGALIGIGWVYTKVLAKEADDAKEEVPT
jgi:uncharacterized membrane protein